MNRLFAHPATALLARLKLRGWWRAQRRRFKRPGGVVFGIFGLMLLGLWIGSIFLRTLVEGAQHFDADQAEAAAGLGLTAFALMTVVSAFAHRGLYLPRAEVERLLSSPVPRWALVRYRVLVTMFRGLPFTLIVAFLMGLRMPRPGFGVPAAFLALLTLPLLGQLTALVLGGAESRLSRWVERLPSGLLRAGVGVLVWLVVMLFVFGDDRAEEGSTGMELLRDLAGHPAVEALTLPVRPWASAATATGAGEFLGSFGLALVLWGLLFQVTTRLPVDFRERSLATSTEVTRRLARMRSGRGLFGGAPGKRAAGWRVPWLFGRGPFGAVAWLRLGALMRKARSTLLLSLVVVALAVGVGSTVLRDDALGGAVLMGVLGVFYLGSGLRLDFRGDLDRMEQVLAWPLRPSRIFLASVLPVTLVVSLLVDGAILVRAMVIGSFDLPQLAVLGAVPPLAYLWIAIDNAAYLLFPVRFTPGQAGALQHMGRSVLLMFLRFLFLALLTGAVGGVAALVFFAGGEGEDAALYASVASAGLLVGAFAVATAFGAWALARFDVARAKVET